MKVRDSKQDRYIRVKSCLCLLVLFWGHSAREVEVYSGNAKDLRKEIKMAFLKGFSELFNPQPITFNP